MLGGNLLLEPTREVSVRRLVMGEGGVRVCTGVVVSSTEYGWMYAVSGISRMRQWMFSSLMCFRLLSSP